MELVLCGNVDSCDYFVAGGASTELHHLSNVMDFHYEGIVTIKNSFEKIWNLKS